MFSETSRFCVALLLVGSFVNCSYANIWPRDCGIYRASKSPYTIRGVEYRASHGMNCTKDHTGGSQSTSPDDTLPNCDTTSQCVLQTYDGSVPARSTLNVTLVSRDDEHHLFRLIGRATDLDFHRTVNASFHAGMASSCLDLGQSGYIGAYPSLRCTEGVVSDCGEDSPVTNDTAVRACAPVRFGSEASLSFEFVNTTALATANMTDDPILPMGISGASDLGIQHFLWLVEMALISFAMT